MPLSYKQRLQLSTRVRRGATLGARTACALYARGITPQSIRYGGGGIFANKKTTFFSDRAVILSSGRKELKLHGNNIIQLREGESVFLDSQEVTNIMNKILEEARENTPIDKRYIGFRANTTKKQEKLYMPSFSNEDARKKVNSDNLTGSDRKRASKSGRAIRDNPKAQMIEIDLSGFVVDGNNYYFSEETKKKIKDKFSGDNREQRRNLWYNLNRNSLEYYKIRKGHNALKSESKNTAIGYAFSDSQEHGGEEELKRSGMYDKETHTISFDPTRFGAKYNYASIQHNRLDFDHLVGGPLFLYNAYAKYKNELSSAIMGSIKDFRLSQERKARSDARAAKKEAEQKAEEKKQKNRDAVARHRAKKAAQQVSNTVKQVEQQAQKQIKQAEEIAKKPWKYTGITRSGKSATDLLGW